MKFVSRRDFIGAFAAASALGFPAPCRANGAAKLRMAFIGIGNQGHNDFRNFMRYGNLVDAVALADVEMEGPRTQKTLALAPHSARYRDWRELFERHAKELDAVCVATPDFSHFPVVMEALERRISVYCEKPMGASFREVELMSAAAAKAGVVTQMGNQGHSGYNYWQMKELVANGTVRDVVRIEAHMNASRRWHKWKGAFKGFKEETPPGWLDWKLWLAQRPARPYSGEYVNGGWRCFPTLGNGALGDWGAHIFDAAWEFLELGMPERITVKREGANPFTFPMASTVEFAFPARGAMPACTIVWRDGVNNRAPVPESLSDPKWRPPACGEELYLADGRVFARETHGNPMAPIAGMDPRDPQVRKVMRDYPRDRSEHFLNFINAVKGLEKPNSPFSTAGGLSKVLSLGVIAQTLGDGTLEFDREKNRFKNSDAANAMLEPPAA